MWIQTYTGRAFSYVNPSPNDVDITDIAVALSRIPRYLGHTSQFYSVAQHCANAVICPEAGCGRNHVAQWALLHDAAEAYMGDLPGPLKRLLPDYSAIEDAVLAAIAQRFGLPPCMPPEIKLIDRRLLATEFRDLQGEPLKGWSAGAEPYGDMVIRGLGPDLAAAGFLAEFKRLFG
jgi:uncharacterized protein